jgi:hypothetical protein
VAVRSITPDDAEVVDIDVHLAPTAHSTRHLAHVVNQYGASNSPVWFIYGRRSSWTASCVEIRNGKVRRA